CVIGGSQHGPVPGCSLPAGRGFREYVRCTLKAMGEVSTWFPNHDSVSGNGHRAREIWVTSKDALQLSCFGHVGPTAYRLYEDVSRRWGGTSHIPGSTDNNSAEVDGHGLAEEIIANTVRRSQLGSLCHVCPTGSWCGEDIRCARAEALSVGTNH